jgi:hypothetical protein
MLFLGILAAPPGLAQGEWRTEVQVTVGSGVGTQFAFDGGLNVPSSTQTLSAAFDAATATASSALNANGLIPTLRARAISVSMDAQAVAWGVQSYVNTSGSALDTSLVLQLDANITGNNDVEARVYLFEIDNFEFFQDNGTMLFESSSQLWPGFETFANNLGPTGFDVVIKNTPGAVSETRQFDFTVPPGVGFYVWARLVTTADVAGEVDAFSTLTASLTETAGLVTGSAPPAPVPALGPAAVIALIVLLAILGAGTRYRSVDRST